MPVRGGNLQGIRNLPTMIGGMGLMPGSRGWARQSEAINRAGGPVVGANMSTGILAGQPFNPVGNNPVAAPPVNSTPSTGGGVTVGGNVPGLNIDFGSNPALDMFRQLFGANTEGSIQSFNKASNRLRERLDSASAGQAQQAKSDALSRGFVGGNLQGTLQDINANNLSAYGQGLAGLESDFENKRLQGLGQAFDAASGISGDYSNSADRALKQWLAQLQSGTDLQIAREGNKTQVDLNRINNNSRSLQDLLDNLTGIIGGSNGY